MSDPLPDQVSHHQRIEVSCTGPVTVVRFIDRKIEDPNVHELGNELFALVEQDSRRSIVLNFSHVEFLSSAALGKLLTLDRRLKAADGHLKLCCIRPEILEVFQITRLNKVFDIRSDEQEAVAAF